MSIFAYRQNAPTSFGAYEQRFCKRTFEDGGDNAEYRQEAMRRIETKKIAEIDATQDDDSKTLICTERTQTDHADDETAAVAAVVASAASARSTSTSTRLLPPSERTQSLSLVSLDATQEEAATPTLGARRQKFAYRREFEVCNRFFLSVDRRPSSFSKDEDDDDGDDDEDDDDDEEEEISSPTAVEASPQLARSKWRFFPRQFGASLRPIDERRIVTTDEEIKRRSGSRDALRGRKRSPDIDTLLKRRHTQQCRAFNRFARLPASATATVAAAAATAAATDGDDGSARSTRRRRFLKRVKERKKPPVCVCDDHRCECASTTRFRLARTFRQVARVVDVAVLMLVNTRDGRFFFVFQACRSPVPPHLPAGRRRASSTNSRFGRRRGANFLLLLLLFDCFLSFQRLFVLPKSSRHAVERHRSSKCADQIATSKRVRRALSTCIYLSEYFSFRIFLAMRCATSGDGDSALNTRVSPKLQMSTASSFKQIAEM